MAGNAKSWGALVKMAAQNGKKFGALIKIT